MAATLFDWLFHLDTHLATLAAQQGAWVYLILAAVILLETGLVVMPFLPGDSLLFVSGALAASGTLSLAVLVAVLAAAAIAGDAANFAIGAWCARHVAADGQLRWIKREHLEKTRGFFERHGRKTIILARFVPIVRTLAPFVAAMGHMPYRTFLLYNAIGGALWVALLTGTGYLFGQVQWIQTHLTVALLGIVAVSVLPAVFEWWKSRRAA